MISSKLFYSLCHVQVGHIIPTCAIISSCFFYLAHSILIFKMHYLCFSVKIPVLLELQIGVLNEENDGRQGLGMVDLSFSQIGFL